MLTLLIVGPNCHTRPPGQPTALTMYECSTFPSRGGSRAGRTPRGEDTGGAALGGRRTEETAPEGHPPEGHHDGRRPRGGDRAGRTPRGEEATGDGGIRMGVAGRGEPGDGRGLELGRQPKPARTSVSGAPLVTALPTL